MIFIYTLLHNYSVCRGKTDVSKLWARRVCLPLSFYRRHFLFRMTWFFYFLCARTDKVFRICCNLLLFYFINLFLPHLVLITKCLTKKRKYLFSLRLDFSRYGQLAVLGTILYLSFMHSSKTSERWIIHYLLKRASTWGKEKMDLTYNSYIPYV